jgi:BirA family biotin operon repressor/biotin-[acetyl-CoA-carboxylase] ligase
VALWILRAAVALFKYGLAFVEIIALLVCFTFRLYDLQNTAFLNTLADRLLGDMALQVIGTAVYHFPALDSTNAFALKLLSQIRPKPGTVVFTDYQTAGRGQIGRGWHSDKGRNICMSIITYPDIRPQNQFRLTIAASLAVRATVAHFLGDDDTISVKWPNDIYIADKKIAGILIQTTIQGNRLTSCVTGIGLNVNETDFPDELPNPTSILKSLSRQPGHQIPPIDIDLVKQKLLQELNWRLFESANTSKQFIEEYYRALYRRNIVSQFKLPDGTLQSGILLGTDSQGHLLIEWKNGNIISYQHREIDFVI